MPKIVHFENEKKFQPPKTWFFGFSRYMLLKDVFYK